MTWKLQVERKPSAAILLLVALAFAGFGGAASVGAQAPKADRPPQHQPSSSPAPHTNSAPPRGGANSQNANRAPARTQVDRPLNNSTGNRPTAPNRTDRNIPPNRNADTFNRNENRPPAATMGPNRQNNFNNRPYDNNSGARMSPRQQVGAGAPRPFVDTMRDLSPRDRDRVLQNSHAFQNLAPEQQSRIRNQFNQWDRMTPQQRSDLREKEQVWRNLTPDQKQHIKSDVLPQWKQMPWARQQVIQQKLGILQNMPESARNRRLNDPEFTRGMSDNEKSMLHDLSHLHVGGAPDPPSNEP